MLPPTERLKLLSPERATEVLLAEPEGQWFDRKSARIKPRELAIPLISFANADGGVLAIGLHDSKCEGIGDDRRTLNGWLQAGREHARPAVPFSATELACINNAGIQDRVLLLDIPASSRVHATRKDDVYRRVGDSDYKLQFDERTAFEYERGNVAYELQPLPPGLSVELDRGALEAYAGRIGHPEPERVLNARGLEGEDGSLLSAGALLFGVHPQNAYPQAHVRVLRYRGTDARTGASQNLARDARCEGRLPEQIERAKSVVAEEIPAMRALGPDGRFEWIPIVPEDAWLEALVNAVVHRAYSDSGDHIRVSIFDDRVEVVNPGMFPGGAPPADLRGVRRFPRNPRIARVMAELAYGQDLGEGLRRMVEIMELSGRPAPSVHPTPGGVRVTLRGPTAESEKLQEMSELAQTLYEMIGGAGRLRTGEIAAMAGIVRPTALRHLNALADAGLVRRVAKSRNDPHAHWVIRRA